MIGPDLTELGAEHDAEPIPPAPIAPWAPGDTPRGLDLDLNEYPVELLKIRQCRSFRADLRHKLTIIIRACGGYGHGGLENAATLLEVSRQTLNKWLRWHSSPRSVQMMTRIDNRYADALEKLVAEKVKKKK